MRVTLIEVVISMSTEYRRCDVKVKEFHYQQLEDDFELDLNYQEWLMENYSEPSEDELNEMEEEFRNSSTVKNQIIAETLANNQDYDPTTRTGA